MWLRTLAVGVTATLALAGCTPAPGPATGGSTAPAGVQVLDHDQTVRSLERLGSSPGKDLAPNRLAEGLVPPTNRWYSGLVFGATSQPVFPLPLSFGVDAEGFGFGVPQVTTTAKTIMGGFRPVVKVAVPGASDWDVVAYDELSVTLGARGASGRVTIASGSPYVTFSSGDGVKLATNVVFSERDGYWLATDATGTYGLVAEGATVAATSVDVRPGGRVTWFAVPADGQASDLARLAAPVTGGSVAYATGARVSTTLRYHTAGDAPTAVAALPHQLAGLQGECSLGTYPSVLGTMRLCKGNELTFNAPSRDITGGLDLTKLPDADRAELATLVAADVAAARPYPADTYFGGKALHRDAQLYLIAKQVGADEQATVLKRRITETLLRWFDPAGCTTASAFCFTYDATNRGIVGQTPSFGSDEFNDHHFHYGYFLYTAGIMAADDPALVERLRPVADLLAADIASSVPSAEFPVRRNFDPYAGHSWASGTSPFADGNNQESSSEAVQAWAGLTLWARASGNTALAEQGEWLHSLEAATALAYYVEFDRSQPVYQGFAHQISPLIFGGKRDYATWFSPEPAAALAIQLLPLSPSLGYLDSDAGRIADNLREGLGGKGYEQTYGDWLLLYSGLTGEPQRQAALEEARRLPAEYIDDGNTRSYLVASLMSLRG